MELIKELNLSDKDKLTILRLVETFQLDGPELRLKHVNDFSISYIIGLHDAAFTLNTDHDLYCEYASENDSEARKNMYKDKQLGQLLEKVWRILNT